MNFKNRFYPESRLSGFSNIDGTLAFYNQVNALLTAESVVVDIGCGRGAYGEDPIAYRRSLRILKGKCRKVIGIDVSDAGRENPFLDEFRLISGERWPVEDCVAQICLADNVLEHVQNPALVFQECRRVLSEGGFLCIRTPNLWSYFGLVSRAVPTRSHVDLLRRAKDRVKEEDTFPTFYRCNTIPGLRSSLLSNGFEPVVYGYEAEPSYLSFSPLAYYLGMLYQRFAPGIFRVGIHAFGKKVA
jgi:SAM-dependent methyltransferase